MTLYVALAVTLILVAGILLADKYGEAETLERRNPDLDCTVVLDRVWFDVECQPAPVRR